MTTRGCTVCPEVDAPHASVWRSFLTATLAILLSAATSACGSREPGRLAIGSPAPEYVATTMAGDSVRLTDFRGDVVLLNLWATWCAPCRHETPYLQSLHEARSAEGLKIVGVSMDTGEASDRVRDFVERYSVSYTILLDPEMSGMTSYQVLGLPATYLIDRDGVLRWMRFGPVAEDDPDFQAALNGVLK